MNTKYSPPVISRIYYVASVLTGIAACILLFIGIANDQVFPSIFTFLGMVLGSICLYGLGQLCEYIAKTAFYCEAIHEDLKSPLLVHQLDSSKAGSRGSQPVSQGRAFAPGQEGNTMLSVKCPFCQADLKVYAGPNTCPACGKDFDVE